MSQQKKNDTQDAPQPAGACAVSQAGETVLLSVAALLLAGVAGSESRLFGLQHGPDLEAACLAMAAMGARIGGHGNELSVRGTGNGALLAPQAPLDFRQAPVALALVAGLVAAYDFPVTLTSARMPEALLTPLLQMGLQIEDTGADHLRMRGPRSPSPLCWPVKPPDAAQLAASLLLAGLNTPGTTMITETCPEPSPITDRLENLFAAFAAQVSMRHTPEGLREIRLVGRTHLSGATVDLTSPARVSGQVERSR